MTDAGVSPDALADRIAGRGRDALVARLRAAYAEAANAHADIVSIDEDRIEAMVQQAADRADGLQWRRALAEVASEELGISLTEALANPAVARAQELVGAPSYESSLADLIANPVPGQNSDGAAVEQEPTPAVTAEPAEVEAVVEMQEMPVSTEPQPDLEPVDPEPQMTASEPEAQAAEPEMVSEPEPLLEAAADPEPRPMAGDEDGAGVAYAAPPNAGPELDVHHEPMPTVEHPMPAELGELHDLGDLTISPTEAHEEVALADGHAVAPHDAEEDQLRVSAIHLGGVANLPVHEDGLDLRLSGSGLDIMHENDEIIGRLLWSEIDDLEVPATRGRLRRSGRGRARLTVRTQHGDASFEVPAFSSDELRDRVDELLDRYGRY